MVVYFTYWYKLKSMSNKYKSKNWWFWHRRSRWNEHYKQWLWCSKRYWCCELVKIDLPFLSCPIRKLKILRLWPLIFKKYLAILFWALRCVHLFSVLKVCILQILKGNIYPFFKRPVHPRNSKNKCLTLAISHFVLLSQTLFVHSWGGQFAWKKCNFKMHMKNLNRWLR